MNKIMNRKRLAFFINTNDFTFFFLNKKQRVAIPNSVDNHPARESVSNRMKHNKINMVNKAHLGIRDFLVKYSPTIIVIVTPKKPPNGPGLLNVPVTLKSG